MTLISGRPVLNLAWIKNERLKLKGKQFDGETFIIYPLHFMNLNMTQEDPNCV